MTRLRPTAVAGQFYPNDAQVLTSWFQQWMKPVAEEGDRSLPRVLIVPHAGYVYSGEAAAKGYQHWLGGDDTIKTVVVIGPAHRVPFNGMTALSVDGVETPMGPIALDTALRDEVVRVFPWLNVADATQQQEHSLEVQFPFIKTVLPNAKVLPLLNGAVDPLQVAQVVKALWKFPHIYFVISSDLSHFHTYDQANELDGETAKMVANYDWKSLSSERACGYKGVQGVLAVLSKNVSDIQQLELINSGDTAGDKQRVVGYGTWAIYEKSDQEE